MGNHKEVTLLEESEALWTNGPVNSPLGGPWKEKYAGVERSSRVYFPPSCPARQTANTSMLQRYYRCSKHRHCSTRESVINVLSSLYFLSDQR